LGAERPYTDQGNYSGYSSSTGGRADQVLSPTAMFLAQHGIASLGGRAAARRLAAAARLFFHMRTLEMFPLLRIEDEVRAQSGEEFEPEGALIIMDTPVGQEARRHHPEPERGRRCAEPLPASVHAPSRPRADPARRRALKAARKCSTATSDRRRAGPDGVTVTVNDIASGRKAKLRGKYLIGADGRAQQGARGCWHSVRRPRRVLQQHHDLLHTPICSPELLGKPLSVIYINNPGARRFFRSEQGLPVGLPRW
jgi:hypothetical protein